MDNMQETWKKELCDIYTKVLSGTASQEEIERVGYVYQRYAPQMIYKYFSDNEFCLNTIANDKMWYSSPVCFNDVFDAYFTIDGEKIKQTLLNYLRENSDIRESSPAWANACSAIDSLTENFQIELDKLRLNFGVTCFSESDNSLLMWSHYAHYHKGLCVEYELLEFSNQIRFSPAPVVYCKKRPCINEINLDDREFSSPFGFLLENLLTKSPEWSYEREWRIIRDHGACGDSWDDEKHGALLPSIKPHAVILGCDASEDFSEKVLKICQERKIALFRMEKDEVEYKLRRNQILSF